MGVWVMISGCVFPAVDPEAEIRDEKEGTGFLEPSADTPDVRLFT